MSSKAQNPCVARKAFCPRTWPSPHENPRDCPATQFKSTPPIFPRKPNQSADLQDTTLQLTGRQSGHQFHTVVSLLFELEAQQQPLEFIFPREGPLHA